MKRLILSILLVLALASEGWGAIYTCNSDADVDTAIATPLVNGDTIIINSSWTSNASYVINKRVTIYGSAPTNTITLGADVAFVFVLNLGSDGSVVRDFTINCDKASRTTGSGINCSATNLTISGMTINNAFNYGIVTDNSTDTNSGTITECTINNVGGAGISKASTGNGIRVGKAAIGWAITDNIISCDSSSSDGIFIQEADGNTISRNTITNVGRDGIYIYNGSNNNIISENVITNVALSPLAANHINVAGTNNQIFNNVLTQSIDPGVAVWGIEFLGVGSHGSVAYGNMITGAYMLKGFGGGGSAVSIYRNWISAKNCGVYFENPASSTVYYNVILVNGGVGDAGIWFESTSTGSRAAHAYNNTIYNLGSTQFGIKYEEMAGTFSASNVKNNIIYGFSKGLVIEDKDNDGHAIWHTNNLFYGNRANIQKDVGGVYKAIALDRTELTSNPHFVNAAEEDFHLQSSSRCINAGTRVGFTSDIEKVTVPYGTTPDMGAYEYYQQSIYYIGPGRTYATFTALVAAKTLYPSDIVDGGYNTFAERWLINGSGIAGNPITLRNATIDGSTKLNCYFSNAKHYITFQNMTMGGSISHVLNAQNSKGIKIIDCNFTVSSISPSSCIYAGNCDDFEVTSCTFSNITAQAAIYWEGDRANISNNTFTDGNYVSAAVDFEGIINAGATDRATIQSNTFTRTNKTGRLQGDGHCIGLAGGTTSSRIIKHVDILDNVITDCGGAGSTHKRIVVYNCEDVTVVRNKIQNCASLALGVDTNCKDVLVQYNLITGNSLPSVASPSGYFGFLQVSQNTGGCSLCCAIDNVRVENNTIANNDDTNSPIGQRGAIYLNAADVAGFSFINVYVGNNIVYNNLESAGNVGWDLKVAIGGSVTVTSLVLSNNCYFKTLNMNYSINWNGTTYTLDEIPIYKVAQKQDVDSINVNPMFVDVLREDFRLSDQSACIDTGIDLGLILDIAEVSVPQGTFPDIGAYEYLFCCQ